MRREPFLFYYRRWISYKCWQVAHERWQFSGFAERFSLYWCEWLSLHASPQVIFTPPPKYLQDLVKFKCFSLTFRYICVFRANRLLSPSVPTSATVRVMTTMSLFRAWPSPSKRKTSSTSKRWAHVTSADGYILTALNFCVNLLVEIQQWLVDRASRERRLWNRLHTESSKAWKHSDPPGAESQTGQVLLQVRGSHSHLTCGILINHLVNFLCN